MAVIWDDIAEDHRNVITQALVTQLPLITGAVPAIINEVFACGITFHSLNRAEDQIAANLYICQFLFSLCQRCIQQRWKTDI